MVSSHDGRAGAEELSSDPDNPDVGKKGHSKQKGTGTCIYLIGLLYGL